MKTYSTQKVIEILEDKGFSIEDPYNNGTYHCQKSGYRDIKFREFQNGQIFKVLTGHTTNLEKALDMALMEHVA